MTHDDSHNDPDAEIDLAPLGEADNFRAGDSYGPVPLKYRHDGWTPDRQLEFIQHLSENGCVEQAAKAVGMTRASAYRLKSRSDAQAFRLAWEAALDFAVSRLSDVALSRAIHGVAVPIYHKGVQVGERRHFDERLTMFMLRYRDPVRYGRWIDRAEMKRQMDGPMMVLIYRLSRMLRVAWAKFEAALDGNPELGPVAELVNFEDNPNDEKKQKRKRRDY